MLYITVDGGGTKGYFSFQCLYVLQHHFQFQESQFGGIVGISSGAIIAGMFALGMLADVNIDSVEGMMHQLAMSPKTWFTAYQNRRKGRMLRELFGSRTLGDCVHPLYVITCSITGEPTIWTSTNPAHHHLPVATIVDASSAIPLVFPPVRIHSTPHIDGGVCTNSPIALTYILARSHGVPDADIHILSLGSDTKIRTPTPLNLLSCFSRENLSALLASTDRLYNTLVETILGDHLLRLSVENMSEYGVLDCSILPTLKHAASVHITTHLIRIYAFLYRFQPPKINYKQNEVTQK
jgi:predicted acylesterase/phospholipase RssA